MGAGVTAGPSGASSDGGARPAAGSVAQEAALLLEALRGLAARPDGNGDGDGPANPADPSDPADFTAPAGETPGRTLPGHAAACGYCPLCRMIAALGITRPEVIAHLADAGTSVLAALRASLGPDPATGGSPAGTGPAPGRPSRPPVQRIDIT